MEVVPGLAGMAMAFAVASPIGDRRLPVGVPQRVLYHAAAVLAKQAGHGRRAAQQEEFTMTLWLILTIVTSAAAVWLSVPLIRRLDRPQPESAGDVGVDRDRLREVERELRDGQIDAAQAETTGIEIKRRILKADRAQPAAVPGLSDAERRVALVGVTGIVVLGSAILYAVTGNPDPDSTRSPPSPHPAREGLAAQARASDGDGESQTNLPTVEEMTRRLAARLAGNPRDAQGWRMLGWSYLNISRFSDAAEAYAKAIALDPNNPEFRSGRIEALVGAANGVVTSEASAAIGDVLKLDPKDVRARYFEGLAREQDGDKAAALAEWTELLKDVNGDESWAPDLRNRVSALARDTGRDGAAVADGPKPALARAATESGTSKAQGEASSPRVAEKGPSPQDVRAAEAMPPADRSAMIRGMVDGLASRLERSPRDADGWIKLMRSRVVLGESELAKQALSRGLAAFADDAPERDRIAAAAQELGMER
jgi:cytochrome c-type biogenesis protein CcmH